MVFLTALFLVFFASPVLSLTHLICVGCFERDFTAQFTPSSLTAAVGDYVEFQWPNSEAMAHSVTRGSYNGFPCQPAIDGMGEQEGRERAVSSGFIDRFGWDYNTWTIQINNTDPLWFYDCSDCGVRMAGVINPPTNILEGNITDWQAAAVFSVRGISELERCTLREQGGMFANLPIQEMWVPENENVTKTVEDSEGAVEKEKSRRATVSSKVTLGAPTPLPTASSVSSAGSLPTSTNSSTATPPATSETASSRTEPSTASSIASPSTSSTTSNAAWKLGGGKGMMSLRGAIGGVVWWVWI